MEGTNYSVDELIANESFRRWVRGKASEQEKSYWDEWVTGDSKNRRLAICAQQKITGLTIQPASQPDQREAWTRLQDRMGADEAGSYGINRSGRSGSTALHWMYRVAAVFLLAALTGWAVWFMDDSQPEQAPTDEVVRNEVVTGYGERKTINLSDGSVDNTGLDVITSALSNTLDTPIEVTNRAVYIGQEYSNKGL